MPWCFLVMDCPKEAKYLIKPRLPRKPCVPVTQVALNLLGLRASEVRLAMVILAPVTLGPRSGGVIRNTDRETRPSTTFTPSSLTSLGFLFYWNWYWNNYTLSLSFWSPWWPPPRCRCPWGSAGTGWLPPAPARRGCQCHTPVEAVPAFLWPRKRLLNWNMSNWKLLKVS